MDGAPFVRPPAPNLSGMAHQAYTYAPTSDSARSSLASLARARLIGIDTETLYDPQTKRMRLSLIQIAHADDPVIVIDALSAGVEAARDLIESSEVEMAAHNARFDEAVLTDAGLAPRGFIDTLPLARRALRLPSYTLSDVADALLGEQHDKKLQKSNWRRRPLALEQLAYAAEDARLTLRIYEELRARLLHAGDWEDALRGARLEPRSPGERRERKRRTPRPAAAPLTREEKIIVGELKRWRLGYARAHHKPAYMICPDATLEHLAQAKPATIEELKNIYGLGDSKIKAFGEELLEALRDSSPGDEAGGRLAL